MPRRKDSILVDLQSPLAIPATSSSTLDSKGHNRTLSTLNNVIETVNIVKDLVPLAIAKGVLSTVSAILGRVKNTIKNKDDFIELADQCNKISVVIWRATSGTPESEISLTIRRAMSDLQKSLDNIQDSVNDKTKSRIGTQVFHAAINKETIASWQQDLNRFLILFNTELNISSNMKIDELLAKIEEIKNGNNLEIDALLPDALPAIPPIFFGRDALVRETVELLLGCQHVALIGPGGMGKTYIARAVLNDSDISAKFHDARYFVRFDDVGASQITYDIFLDRIARAMGIRTSKANQRNIISKALTSREILIVLDNAETFLDAAYDRDLISNSIDEFGALNTVAILTTTRTTVLPPNLRCTRLHVPALDERSACQIFTTIYHSEINPAILRKLISSLDFHPLSINLLAQAAVQNDWTPEELVEAWKDQQASLLSSGSGKTQSLAITIELSLNSPSLQNYRNTVRQLLEVIAFLPQGVNKTTLGDLFPTITNIQTAAEMLCKHSLAYRRGNFITMLAPIRLYISTKANNASSSVVRLLADVQTYYKIHITRDLVDEGWFRAEDLNIEHVAAISLAQCDAKTMNEACTTCMFFVRSLYNYKPRPTSLLPVVLALEHRDAPLFTSLWFTSITKRKSNLLRKAECIAQLALLYFNLGHIVKAGELMMEAKNISLACGATGRETSRACDVFLGRISEMQGNFIAAEEIYELTLKRAPHFNKTSDVRSMDALIKCALGSVRMFRGKPGHIELMLDAHKYMLRVGDLDGAARIDAEIAHAHLYAGHYDDARARLETVLAVYTAHNVGSDHIYILLALLETAHRQGKESEGFRDQTREAALKCPNPIDRVEALSRIAAYTAMEGNLPQARAEMECLISEESYVDGAFIFVTPAHVVATIELLAENCTKARELFNHVIKLCEALLDVRSRARAERALGEIAYLEKDFETAKAEFTKAKKHCDVMGIAPEYLYYCYSCFMLDEVRFGGWKLFRDGLLS